MPSDAQSSGLLSDQPNELAEDSIQILAHKPSGQLPSPNAYQQNSYRAFFVQDYASAKTRSSGKRHTTGQQSNFLRHQFNRQPPTRVMTTLQYCHREST
jgi:hypothetical protein